MSRAGCSVSAGSWLHVGSPWGLASPPTLSRQEGDLPWSLLQDEGSLLDLDLDFPFEDSELPLLPLNPPVTGVAPEGLHTPAEQGDGADHPAQSAPVASELRQWRCLTCTGPCSFR
jgi:hypothetical protein